MFGHSNKSKLSNVTISKVIRSSTPFKPSIDPVSKNFRCNGHNSFSNDMNLEKIYPGIYMASAKNLCSSACLKMLGFTHIIYIDKHIIERNNQNDDRENAAHQSQYQSSHSDECSSGEFEILTHRITASITFRPTDERASMSTTFVDRTTINRHAVESNAFLHRNETIFEHEDFETLDLNFGESSYLTTVLPNCYKAVKFIDNAMKRNGAVLLVDCIDENQKCITIAVGFLMYKYNKNFITAYQLVKNLQPNIELDKFFITQLYEYEPILQVQRTQLAGNSCSRELRSDLLKRKKMFDDFYYHSDTIMPTLIHDSIDCGNTQFINNIEQMDILME